ncbi:expressed unknown protein [Seminavis robusta]|uniref:DOT1 domain-containing protein n=1 Tax=Seminavis robusta TaxID=568900 RepID=A0A9N8DTD7_9STRA|nr:expressed unknown protein [Seminavis robusta]|eukprot:Sro343_g121860.1 n/a (495) ;mRNA; f:532-2016
MKERKVSLSQFLLEEEGANSTHNECQRQLQLQPHSLSSSSVLSNLLWMPIHQLQDKRGLVGVPIRKHFSPGIWCNGVIINVKAKSKKSKKRGILKYCTIRYYHNNNLLVEKEQEDLRIDETLDLWIIAYEMFHIPPAIRTTLSTPTLFQHYNHHHTNDPKTSAAPYTLNQFLQLLAYTEQVHGGATMEDMESSRLIQIKPHSTATEVYGRMLPHAMDKILRHYFCLKPTDSVVDIGHGIGNSCLQAAYTIGCKARGIECDKARNAVAQILARRLQDAVHTHQTRDGMTFTPGSVLFRHGNLQDLEHQEFLSTDLTHIFFDNWNGVFSGERGNAKNLERYVAAWFAAAPEGTVMCTVSPLRAALGCLPLAEALKIRQQRNLALTTHEEMNLASYYTVADFELGTLASVYNFGGDEKGKTQVRCYRYVRTRQNRSMAVFLCNNPLCDKAKRGIPIEAIQLEESPDGKQGAVIGACECRVSDRVLRRKRKRKEKFEL